MLSTPSTLWDVQPPARAGHVTQLGAARAVAGRAPGMRERVFEFIRSQLAGAINEEIAAALGMKIQTVCGRVNELQQQGRVAWTPGEYRDTSAGVKAKVWRVRE